MTSSQILTINKGDYFLYDKKTQLKPINWYAICQDGSAPSSPCVIGLLQNFTSTTLRDHPELFESFSVINEVRHSSGGKKGELLHLK